MHCALQHRSLVLVFPCAAWAREVGQSRIGAPRATAQHTDNTNTRAHHPPRASPLLPFCEQPGALSSSHPLPTRHTSKSADSAAARRQAWSRCRRQPEGCLQLPALAWLWRLAAAARHGQELGQRALGACWLATKHRRRLPGAPAPPPAHCPPSLARGTRLPCAAAWHHRQAAGCGGGQQLAAPEPWSMLMSAPRWSWVWASSAPACRCGRSAGACCVGSLVGHVVAAAWV